MPMRSDLEIYSLFWQHDLKLVILYDMRILNGYHLLYFSGENEYFMTSYPAEIDGKYLSRDTDVF